MTGEFKYKDKNVGKNVNDKGSLQYLVNEEFKKIDRIGYRDDQEILDAGCNVIKSMINEIKKDKNIVYGEWSLGPLINLHKKFIDEYNSLTGPKLLTNNADKIYQVAKSIDNAENETLERLKRNRTVQDSRDVVSKSQEIDSETPIFVMEKKNGQDTGNIIFTKAANSVSIEQALKGLFTDPNKAYIIDYSNCDTSTPKGKAIKEKMISLIGTNACYLGYDNEQKTYTIRNQSGIISDKAYIWEGVKLIPDGLRQWNAYNEKKEMDKKIGSFDETRVENQVKDLSKDMPSANKLSKEQQKNLIRKTEYRINELLKKAKSLGYKLKPEPISKIWFGRGLMELHLISGSSEVDRTFWERIGQIGEDLFQYINDNQGEYKTYLTKRVWEKWRQMDELTETENVDVSDVGLDKIDDSDKINILKGIGRLEYMINNFIESEGDSWIDTDDRRLVQMKKILRNGRISLENADNRGKNAIINNILDPFRNERYQFKGIPKTSTYNEGTHYSIQYNYLNDVFFGTPEKQRIAIREMGSFNRLIDKTETSFIAEEIANGIEMEIENEDGTKSRLLETNDEHMNKFIENIESIFTFKDDEFDNMKNDANPRKIFIDKIYSYKIGDKEGDLDGFIKLFVENGLFPAGWESYTKDIRDLVKEKFKQLKKTLDNNIAQINSLSIKNIEEQQHKDRLMLEMKEKKTEEDKIKLQGLIYLEDNKEEQEKINKVSLEETKLNLKYGNIDTIVKGTLFPVFAEMGGGAKGINADIYNDIKGIGNWNLSDENAKWVGEMVVEIAITVAIAVATGGAGAALMQGILRGAAKAVAKVGALAFLAPRIYRIAEVAYTGYRSLKRGGKAIKLAYSSVSLLAEGTIFNATTTAIHAAVNGTSFDGMNLNPFAQENIQTAAFLGTLSLGNKAGMKVLTKLHGKTKIEAFSKAGLSDVLKNYKGIWTESLILEATAMFGTEQGMNFVFGHDVYNSATGKIDKKRSLERPTEQEWIQMIGMLLAFKMVKPQLRHDYAQKLNKGTLEICRGVKKNEVLLRDPKTGEIINLIDLINGKDNSNSIKLNTDKSEIKENGNKKEENNDKISTNETAKTKDNKSENKTNIEKLKELGIDILASEIKDIKDLELTQKQIENIKRIKDELGIYISVNDIETVKDLALTQEQIENIKRIKDELGINIYANHIETVKDLTQKQIENIKRIKDELGINIYANDIETVKDLTQKQIENIKRIKNELGINIYANHIETVKDLALTQEQIENIKRIKNELGINIYADNIETVKDLKQKQIENIKRIKNELGIDISGFKIKIVKDLDLTQKQIENIKRIKNELGIDILAFEIKDIKDLDLTQKQIENIKRIKNELGIDILASEIKDIKDLDLTQKQIENIKRIKNKLGIDISVNDIEILKDLELTQEQIENINKLKIITGEEKVSFGKIRDIIKEETFNEKLDNITKNKKKIELLTGEKGLSIQNIKDLIEIENLSEKLDNIIKNMEKIKLLTWKTKLSTYDIQILSKIENLSEKLDIIINNKNKIEYIIGETLVIHGLVDIECYSKRNTVMKNFSRENWIRLKEMIGRNPWNDIKRLMHMHNGKKIELINDTYLKVTKENGIDYIIINKYGSIYLEYIGNKTYIFHAGMDKGGGFAFERLADVIPEGYKITETLSLSVDSFPIYLNEYQRRFRTNYTVRATGKFIYLNSDGKFSPDSQIVKNNHVGIPNGIFEAATQANAQKVANKINEGMIDCGHPLEEGQGIIELPKARVVQNPENGLRRVELPQIEMTKENNNGVELARQLNKCATYNEMENILLENLTTEYHFRDGILTGEKLLRNFRGYRKTYIDGLDVLPRKIDPRHFIPAEFIEPTKWSTPQGSPTWRNTTKKSHIHKLLDSK